MTQPSTQIRRLADPERFRQQYRGTRHYKDREQPDSTWEPMADTQAPYTSVTTIAKVVGSGAFYKKVGDSRVPLDAYRVAQYVNEAWGRLADMDTDERLESMALSAGRDLQRAAGRGHAVHGYLEAVLRGETPMVLEDDAEPYREVADLVAAHYQPILAGGLQEFVVFRRATDDGGTGYGGTGDALGGTAGDGPIDLLDWKTRGPDSKHGCYEKEVAQLGLLALADYYFDVDPQGQLARRPMAPIRDRLRLSVVSIRPDSYEVYPVDLGAAMDVANYALELRATTSTAGKVARKAVGSPQPMPAAPAVPSAAGEAQDTSAETIAPNDGAEVGEPAEVVDATSATPLQQSQAITEWALARFRELVAAGHTQMVIQRWPQGVPGPKQAATWTTEQAEQAKAVIIGVFDVVALPYSEPEPAVVAEIGAKRAAKAAKAASAATPPVAPELPTVADSGGAAPEVQVEALQQFAQAAPADQRVAVQRWLKQGQAAKRPFHTASADPTTNRCVAAVEAALAVAEHTTDDEVARGWLALVTQIGDSWPPGVIFGSMSVAKARKLLALARECDSYAGALNAVEGDTL